MASVRLEFANGGGHLVMPLGHYVRVRGGTTGEVLREAFREGEKVTWTAMGGDGREVASGEATARHRGGPKGEGPRLPGPPSGGDDVEGEEEEEGGSSGVWVRTRRRWTRFTSSRRWRRPSCWPPRSRSPRSVGCPIERGAILLTFN